MHPLDPGPRPLRGLLHQLHPAGVLPGAGGGNPLRPAGLGAPGATDLPLGPAGGGDPGGDDALRAAHRVRRGALLRGQRGGGGAGRERPGAPRRFPPGGPPVRLPGAPHRPPADGSAPAPAGLRAGRGGEPGRDRRVLLSVPHRAPPGGVVRRADRGPGGAGRVPPAEPAADPGADGGRDRHRHRYRRRELVVALLPGGPDGDAGAPERLGADREQHRAPDLADGRGEGALLPRAVRDVRRRHLPAGPDHRGRQRLRRRRGPAPRGTADRRRGDRPGDLPPGTALPSRPAFLPPRGDGARGRRAGLPAPQPGAVRPDHLRPPRLPDPDLPVRQPAPGELPLHRGGVPGGAGPPGPGRGPRPLQLLPRDVAPAEAGRDAGDDLRRAPLRGQLRGLGAGRGVDRRAPPESTPSPPGPTSTAPTARSRRKERR